MKNARTNAGLTILPDGRVAITGGSGGGDQGNDINQAVYSVAIWDPQTNDVVQQADEALARLYHSSALILPDGTVFFRRRRRTRPADEPQRRSLRPGLSLRS
ncbi:hypothetical protein QW131_33335 [Roseibium salinum]|nr:hypothetical protein [Roseibium salinum]